MRYNHPVEFQSYIAPDGSVYNFNNGVDRFVWGLAGEGLPPIEYITQRGPFQQGESVIDYRLRPRLITLIHRRNLCDRDDYWLKRASIQDYLRPNRQALNTFVTGTLRKRIASGVIRDIDVLVTEGLNFDEQSDKWQEFSIEEAIRFIAFNPLYYNPTSSQITFTVESDDELVFPITFPIEFGSVFIDDTQNITYSGTFASYPTIVITGPAKGPTFTNVATGEVLSLNYNIPSGVIVTISLAEGNKTVTDSLGNNLIGAITQDSDFATFHLEPSPGAAAGLNPIRFTAAGAQPGETEVVFSWQERFIGV